LFALGLLIPPTGIGLVVRGGFGEHVVGSSTTSLWIAVHFIGVGGSSLTFWFILVALRHIPAGTAAQLLSLTTLVGFVGAVALLGEKSSWRPDLGASVVVASLVAIARGEAGAGHTVDDVN
jgi:drug/metabolite transporter (DMT)-like permease